jgi:hypothetical protein
MMTSPQVSWLFFKAGATSISRLIRKERATPKNSHRTLPDMGNRHHQGCGAPFALTAIPSIHPGNNRVKLGGCGKQTNTKGQSN